MSTDGCNATKAKPCAAGGRLDLFTSPALRGADADWTQLLVDDGGMFTTNMTVSGGVRSPGAITGEFVTSGYFGGIPGDPDGGSTRVVTQNRAGATFWVGKQEAGGKFDAMWDVPGAVGHYDYGSLTMARTLGSDDPNQVLVNGRRVLLGWIGGRLASQSLARDLSLSPAHELLQAFVPELAALRETEAPRTTARTRPPRSRSSPSFRSTPPPPAAAARPRASSASACSATATAPPRCMSSARTPRRAPPMSTAGRRAKGFPSRDRCPCSERAGSSCTSTSMAA